MDTETCPVPSGTLSLYALPEGVYTITENVDVGTCKALAIMLNNNPYWLSRIEGLVVNLDNR